jgi:hypothetical protein
MNIITKFGFNYSSDFEEVWLVGLWSLMQLSTIFHLFLVDKFYW